MSANHTPEMCKRQCSRLRRHRGDGSTPSSRGSSLSNRRMRRSSSRKSEDLNSSSDLTPKRYRKKRHSSRESRKSVEDSQRERQCPSTRSSVKSPFLEEKKVMDPTKHINLNKVLMQRLMENQRNGTRSADGTPVSLRRNGTHEYNGKYLRNPHVSKLINSNTNLIEKRTSLEEKRKDLTFVKKRSSSLNQPPAVPPRNVKVGNTIDKEGDLKYRKLIREAEHFIDDYRGKSCQPEYLSPTLSTKSAIFPAPRPPPRSLYPFQRIPDEAEINSQINLLQQTINNNPVPKIENEEGIFKTISKTLEKIIIRTSVDSKKQDKNTDTIKNKKKTSIISKTNQEGALSIFNNPQIESVNQKNDYVNNPVPIRMDTLPDSNDNLYKDMYDGNHIYSNEVILTHNVNYDQCFKGSHDVDRVRTHESCNRVHPSPNLIQKMTGSKTWSDVGRKTMCEIENGINCNDEEVKTPLNSFKSFNLGNQLNENNKYCPQSEPVKRKVYACSSTFDKLQKSLRKQKKYEIPDLPTEALRDENITLKEKVAQLRKERLQVEARVRETQQQIDRLRLAEASSHC